MTDQIVIRVTNSGLTTGDCVILVYHSVGDELRKSLMSMHPVPRASLVAFFRIADLAPTAFSSTHCLPLTPSMLALTTTDGSKRVYDGRHVISITTGDPREAPTTLAVIVHKGIVVTIQGTAQREWSDECIYVKGRTNLDV